MFDFRSESAPMQEAAQGKYYYLPNASDKAIAQAASSAMSEAKAG